MEQYWMPKELDFENLRLCLDNYPAESICIRDCGGPNPNGSYRVQGLVKISESLEGKSLDFKRGKNGLYIFIDSNEVFHFPLKDYHKGFSLAYERIEPTEDGIGKMVMLRTGTDPYNSNLPEPRISYLRNIFDHHQVEIFFKGRVNLKFHSWRKKPYWKYWTINKPGNIQEAILKQQNKYTQEDS